MNEHGFSKKAFNIILTVDNFFKLYAAYDIYLKPLFHISNYFIKFLVLINAYSQNYDPNEQFSVRSKYIVSLIY